MYPQETDVALALFQQTHWLVTEFPNVVEGSYTILGKNKHRYTLGFPAQIMQFEFA